MTNRKGFTLVEILIVVIILGILAAIVIPQFTEASNDARLSALSSDLQSVRSQIELYKIHHLDTLPTADIVNELTNRTNLTGTVMPADGAAADYPFGPYLQQFPTNPFVNSASVGDAATDGWTYDTDTGALAASDADHSDL